MANKNIMPPTKERKADTTKNGNDLSGYIERQRKYEERLYPLRINQTTYYKTRHAGAIQALR